MKGVGLTYQLCATRAHCLHACSRLNRFIPTHITPCQDLIVKEGPQVWELLEKGAHIYICGDARRMAPGKPHPLTSLRSKPCVIQYCAACSAGLLRCRRCLTQ